MHYVMTNKGIVLNLEQAFDALMDYNVIFFGEDHDSRVAHEGELALLDRARRAGSGSRTCP